MRLCEQRAQMLRRGAGRKEVTLQRAVLRETFLVVFHRHHDPDARLVLHGDVPGPAPAAQPGDEGHRRVMRYLAEGAHNAAAADIQRGAEITPPRKKTEDVTP